MKSSGRSPVRSLKSFGVSGLLAPDCRVFYDSLFSLQHVGRVSDLLSARLQASGADVARLRALILFTVIQSYRVKICVNGGWSVRGELVLPEPILLECGVDAERIAVGVAFSLPQGFSENFKTIAERIGTQPATEGFDSLLFHIQEQADRLVIRVLNAERKCEIVGLISLAEKAVGELTDPKDKIEVLELDGQLEAVPPPGEYVEMGDLNYEELLEDKTPGKKYSQQKTAKILVKAAQDQAEEEVRQVEGSTSEEATSEEVVAGAKSEEESEAIVKGGGEADEEIMLVKGGKQKSGSDTFVVKGHGGSGEDKTVTIVKGSKEHLGENRDKIVVGGADQALEDGSDNLAVNAATVSFYRQQIDTLQLKIKDLEEQLEKKGVRLNIEPGSEGQADEEGDESGRGIKRLFKKVWPFRNRVQEEEDPEDRSQESSSENPESLVEGATDGDSSPEKEQAASEEKKKEDAEKKEVEEKVDPKLAAQNLSLMVEAGSFDRTVRKIQQEGTDIKSSLKSPKAKKWVDGLLTDLLVEKGKLKEMAKILARGVRQKELEFKNKEKALAEELSRRDDLIKQKEKAIVRAKDQVSQINLQLERVKSSAGGAVAAVRTEKKLNHTKMLLTSAQEENNQLKKRVDELRDSLMKARAQSSGPADAAADERFKGAQRQLEEAKKQNAHLMDRMSEQDKKADEMRKRLEQAMKMAALKKKDADEMASQLALLKKDKVQLEAQLNQLLGGDKKKSAA